MKLAFCFLTVNDVKNIDIWQNWFVNATCEYKIFIHSKNKYNQYPQHSVFKNRQPAAHVQTTWHRTIKAQILLWKEALNWGCDYAILLSESCLPLNHFDSLSNFLQQMNPKSILAHNNPWWSDKRKRSKFKIKGGPQWNIINRQHLSKLTTSQNILNEITRLYKHVDNEIYTATVLNHFHYLNSTQVIKKHTTFVDWSRRSKDRHHPHSFRIITLADQQMLLKASTTKFFARKFNELNKIDKEKILAIQNERLFTFDDSRKVKALV